METLLLLESLVQKGSGLGSPSAVQFRYTSSFWFTVWLSEVWLIFDWAEESNKKKNSKKLMENNIYTWFNNSVAFIFILHFICYFVYNMCTLYQTKGLMLCFVDWNKCKLLFSLKVKKECCFGISWGKWRRFIQGLMIYGAMKGLPYLFN